jgi:hypothetical protein
MSEGRKRGHKKPRAGERSTPHISITSVVVIGSPGDDEDAATVGDGDDRAGSVPSRAHTPMGRWMRRVLQPALVALGTVLASLLHDRGVDADQLILQVSQAERATPVAARVVGFTFVRQDTGESVHFVRQTDAGTSASPSAAAPGEVPAAFRPAFIALGFDWQRPLTIETAARYRNAHALDRNEHIFRTTNGGAFVLTTTASKGDLRELQVRVDTESYQVVHEHLTIPGIGSVDIDDLSPSAAYLPRRAALTVIRPSRDELERAELRVRLLLADTGADLKQRVQISRSPESVRVQTDGDGLRWDPLGTQLRALAHVHVEPSNPGTGTHVVPTDALPTTYGLERWRKRRFGYSASGASVLPKLMESIVTVRQRLTVLADLAKRYPNPRRELSNDARALLGQLVEQHHGRLRGELSSVKDGVFGLWGPVRLRQEGKTAPVTFVAHAGIALTRARTMETAVRTAIARHDLTSDQEQRLRDTFQALWESVYGQTPARLDGDWCVQDLHGGDSKATCGMPRR